MRLNIDIAFAITILVFFLAKPLFAQTTYLSDPGMSYNNIDTDIKDTYGTFDITKCTSISFSVDFSFSNEWSGNPSMEPVDACSTVGAAPPCTPSSIPCAGDPLDPQGDRCCNCWDFMWIQYFVDGTEVFSDLIGVAGETRQSGVISHMQCVDNSTASICITNQNWAADETNTFSNVTLLCWEGQPDITSPNEVCPGVDLDLDGVICDPTVVVNSTWSTTGAGVIDDPSSLMTFVSGAVAGDVFLLTTTDVNGCTGESSIALVASSGTVPPFEIESDLPNDELCPCGTFNLSLPFSVLGSYNHDWTSSDGQTATGWLPAWSGSPTGTYFVPCGQAIGSTITFNVTVTDQISGCTGTDEYIISIVDPPQADADALDLEICEGEDINLLELVGVPGDAWNWSGPNGFTSSLQNPTIPNATISNDGTYFVTVTYESNNYCQSFDQVDIIVNPTSEISLSGGGNVCRGGCMDNDILFNATNMSGVVDVTFAVQGIPISLPGFAIDINSSLGFCWDEPGFLPSFSNDVIHMPLDNPLIGPGTYTLELISVVQAGNDCINLIPPSTVSITLAENPDVELIAPTEVCEGENIMFDDLINDPSVISWDWSGPGGYTNTQAPPQVIFNADPFQNTGTYFLTVTDANGCTASSEAFVDVIPSPNLDETVVIRGCDDGNGFITYDLSFYELEIGSGNNYTFNWFEDPGLSIPIGNPSSYMVSIGVSTVYAEVTGASNCSTTGMFMLLPHPIVPLILEIDPETPCAGDMLTITETNMDFTIDFWYWNDASVTTGSGNSAFLIIDSLSADPMYQTYILTVQDINGCTASTDISFDVNPKPVAGIPDTIFDCDLDMNNSIDFDLTSTINILNNGDPGMQINWYLDDMGSMSIASPNPVTVSPTTVYASISNDVGCESDLVPVTFEFSEGANLTAPAIDSINCGFVILPPIIPSTPNVMYFDQQGGIGNSYMPGDTLYSLGSNTLFVFDPNPCFAGEPQTTFQIVPSPEVMQDSFIEVCQSYVLPDYPVGTNTGLTDTLYLTSITGSGDTLMPGAVLMDSITLYTVFKNGICEAIDSTIIKIEETPFPGTDSTLTICEGYNQSFDFMSLLGNPDNGGVWNDLYSIPDVNDSTDVLLSGVSEGMYSFSYEILNEVCGLHSASVQLNVIAAPFSGVANSISVCNGSQLPNTSLVDLIDLISDPVLGGPDADGNWSEITSSGVSLADPTIVDFTAIAEGDYEFQYFIDASNSTSQNCYDVSSSVIVTVLNQPDAGDSVSITTCIGDVIDLDDILINADTVGGNGSFNNISSIILSPGNIFNTTGQTAGVYEFEYIIPDGMCPGSRAFIEVELTMDVTAGADQQLSVCSEEEINLLGILDPAASIGGTFTNTNNASVLPSNQWTATDADGSTVNFEYAVGGGGNCMEDIANITIDVLPLPDFSLQNPIQDLCNTECVQWTIMPTGTAPYQIMILVDNDDGDSFNQNLNFNGDYILTICNSGSQLSFGLDSLFLGTTSTNSTITIADISDGNCTLEKSIQEDIVTVLESSYSLQQTLCREDSIMVGNTIFDINNQSGDVILTNNVNCDSTVNVVLDFYPVSEFLMTGVRCLDDTVQVGSDTYDVNTPSGMTILENMSVNGCDSLVTVNLIFDDYPSGIENGSYCINDQVILNGSTYSSSNPMGQDTLFGQSSAGCDSIVMVDLDFLAFAEGFENPTLCMGDQIIINGSIYDSSNPIGQDTLFGMSSSGCDSIVMVSLDFLAIAEGNDNATICMGDQIIINGSVYDSSNPIGQDTLFGMSSAGCDSIVSVMIDFYIVSPGDTTINNVCKDLSVIIGDTEFDFVNNSGIATLANASQNGCDSTVNVTVNFTDNQPVELRPQVCENESYISPNGTVYDINNSSGQESLGIAANGCDSLIDIQLDFLSFASFDLTGSYCNGDGIVVNGMTFDINNPSGSATIPGGAQNGCDSTVNVQMIFDRVFEFSVNAPCDAFSMGTATLENNLGTNLPLLISIGGQSEMVTEIPYTFDLPVGANSLELVDIDGCTSFETVEIPAATTGTFEITEQAVSGNIYTLGISTDIDYSSLSWTPASIFDCSNCETVTASIDDDTQVIATIEYGQSCTRSDTLLLVLDQSVFIYIPNVFSPNNDSNNDSFFIQTKDQFSDKIKVETFRVYDRWGNLVFENDDAIANDPNEGWDGTFEKSDDNTPFVANGVYVYIIVFQVEGEPDSRLIKGDLTVIR